MSYRVTKIICPSCEGSGILIPKNRLGREVKCVWCLGVKRLTVDRARYYADNLHSLAIGGYIAGDHDADHADRMKAKARAVCVLAQVDFPWTPKTAPPMVKKR